MVFLKDLFDSYRELLPSLSTKGRFLFAFHVIVERSPVYFQCIAEDPDRILLYKFSNSKSFTETGSEAVQLTAFRIWQICSVRCCFCCRLLRAL